jgi:signal transduction histidine kinase
MSSVRDDAGRPRRRSPSGRFVVLGFSLVGFCIVAGTAWALSQTWTLQQATAEIVNNMLTSIRLLGDLQTAIDRRQLLINRHIVASSVEEIHRVEAQLTVVDREVSAAMRAYEPWTTLPGEREIWDRTRAHLSTLDAPVARALDFSRRDEDKEARDAMDAVEDRFDEIDQDFDELIAINNQAALESLTRYGEIRRQLILLLVAVGLASLVLTVIVGVWAWGRVARREEEMNVTTDTLQVQNRELDAFAGRVAHDIRGVLSSISLATTALEQKLPSDERSTQVLRRSATRMEALVEDLLALARVQAARLGRCDPSEVLAQLANDLAPRLESHHASLRVSASPANVACNEGLLQQALTNLIDNAIKYHRPGVPPEVNVSGTLADGRYCLRVTDNGLGMTREEVERAFEPFYRSPRVRDLPGTGLGLSIVKRIVDATGSALSIETDLGKGTTFVMGLQLAGPPEAHVKRKDVGSAAPRDSLP